MNGMITKIEISGYKSFENFALDLRPFTVIAGINGVGKSNLFDALRHMSSLVSMTLREAFETQRGSMTDLFTKYPNNTQQNNIKYAFEILLPREVEDQFGSVAALSYLRVRYDLDVERGEDGKLVLRYERLSPIKRGEDQFLKRNVNLIHGDLPRLSGGRRAKPFIDTVETEVYISQDGNAGQKRTVSIAGAQRTVLSSITTVEFPHAYATRRFIEGIHFIQLNPEKLRIPSNTDASPYLASDGANLPAVIARLRRSDPDMETIISIDLASIVPSVKGLRLRHDEKRDEYTIFVDHVDGYEIPSKLLSDGTLRVLALIVMGYDPEFSGTIILEEPENGVHPGRISQVVSLLQSMTNQPGQLRQVIANTHSTKLIDSVRDNLVVATPKKKISQRNGAYIVTNMSYVDGDLLSPSEERFAREQLRLLLEDNNPSAL